MAEDEEASNVITTDGEDAQQVREVAANEEADNYNSADDDDVEKYSLKQELSETRETIEIYVCESCYQEFERWSIRRSFVASKETCYILHGNWTTQAFGGEPNVE